jgi:hypothetical protein
VQLSPIGYELLVTGILGLGAYRPEQPVALSVTNGCNVVLTSHLWAILLEGPLATSGYGSSRPKAEIAWL